MDKKRTPAKFISIISCLLFIISLAVLVLSLYHYGVIKNERSKIQDFLKNESNSRLYTNDSVNAALDKGSSSSYVKDDVTLHEFISPEGIKFRSLSQQWDAADLELLYNELLQNQHGEELNSLSEVIVYPEKDEAAAATHQNDDMLCALPFDHPMLSPEGIELQYYRSNGIISLYNGDEKTTVDEMASALSHEYGHHFTRYHMFENEGEALYESMYAKLRDLTPKKAFVDMSDYDFYIANHHKYILEIAAEDYVSLMGSPKSREIADYVDSHERLYDNREPVTASKRNCKVQENLELPMACEIKGLAKYFYSFIKKDAPVFDIKKEMNITLERHSNSYNLVDGYTTMVYYTVNWDKVYGEDAVYTLSVYEDGDCFNTLHAIRTVTAGEDAVAYIGHVSINLGSAVRSINDSIPTGNKVFIVNVITPDGKMYTSDPLKYTF